MTAVLAFVALLVSDFPGRIPLIPGGSAKANLQPVNIHPPQLADFYPSSIFSPFCQSFIFCHGLLFTLFLRF